MKRRELLRHLEDQGCSFVREGAKHTWYVGPNGRSHAPIPLHREVVDILIRKISRELGIAPPRKLQ